SNDVERVVIVVVSRARQSDANRTATTTRVIRTVVHVWIVEDSHVRVFSVVTMAVVDQIKVVVREPQSPVGGNERRLIASPIVVVVRHIDRLTRVVPEDGRKQSSVAIVYEVIPVAFLLGVNTFRAAKRDGAGSPIACWKQRNLFHKRTVRRVDINLSRP